MRRVTEQIRGNEHIGDIECDIGAHAGAFEERAGKGDEFFSGETLVGHGVDSRSRISAASGGVEGKRASRILRCLCEFEVRPPVQRDELLSLDLKCHRHDAAFRTGSYFAIASNGFNF